MHCLYTLLPLRNKPQRCPLRSFHLRPVLRVPFHALQLRRPFFNYTALPILYLSPIAQHSLDLFRPLLVRSDRCGYLSAAGSWLTLQLRAGQHCKTALYTLQLDFQSIRPQQPLPGYILNPCLYLFAEVSVRC